MNNILLVHMGIPKTGTTALQTFLYENGDNLEQYGWCYPNLKKELPEICAWRHTLAKNGDLFYRERWKIDTSADNWTQVWEHVLKHLEKKNVIISAEEFAWRDTAKFLKGAKDKYDNIKVIIYIRRQDRAVESNWNQAIKGLGGYCNTFQEYIGKDDVQICRYHYLEQLNQISEIIGKENLIVRVYEKQQFCGTHHTIASDFLSAIGIEPDWKCWKDCHIHNLGLDGDYIELKRIFNSIQCMEGIDLLKTPVYAWMSEKVSSTFVKDREEKGYFSREEREAFMEQFALENEQIAREYLHREDGVLVYDDNMEYPLYVPYQCNSFEESLIRFFSAMLYQQGTQGNKMKTEIQQLKKHNWLLTEKLLLNNSKGRKWILFGAGQKCKELLNAVRLPVALIVDNDESKMGLYLGEHKVAHPKHIKDWFQYFIVVTCVETDEIEDQLQELGLYKEENYVLAKEYFMY